MDLPVTLDLDPKLPANQCRLAIHPLSVNFRIIPKGMICKIIYKTAVDPGFPIVGGGCQCMQKQKNWVQLGVVSPGSTTAPVKYLIHMFAH